MSFIYLAAPYSHIKQRIREQRYWAACRAAQTLAKEFAVYAPIVHWHPVALHWRLPGDAVFWAKQNRPFVAACEKVFVLRIDGWRESRGIREELRWAKEFGKPVVPYLEL